MKIYTKNANNIHVINTTTISKKFFYHIDDCKFEPNDVFYYDRHDLAIRNYEFNTFIYDSQWDHIKSNPNTKILINYSDDYINIVDVDRFARVLNKRDVNPNQVYFLVMDDNFKDFVIKEFENRGIIGINVQTYNVLLKNINFNKKYESKSDYKFSLLSRNYFPWRLSIVLGLLKENVLKHFNYSFHNFVPYLGENGTIISLDKVRKDAGEEGYILNESDNLWINNMPYDLGNRKSKWCDVTYEAISCADFHILIESHFDAYLFDNFSHYKNSFKIEEFSPAFPTEKTWKAIFCKKPFIVAAAPYFLKDLKKMGFKTFSPFIDESYDNEEDNKKRAKMIVNESKRICNLSQEEYSEILFNCDEIVKHNFNILKKLHTEIKFDNKFSWLNDLKS